MAGRHQVGVACVAGGLGWALAIFVGLLSGGPCPAAETLTLQGASPRLIFDDNAGGPRKWTVFADDGGFDIENTTSGVGTFPFRISAAAGSNALIVTGSKIGINTIAPATKLHLVEQSSATEIALRLQLVTPIQGTWDLSVEGDGFHLRDVQNVRNPFTVRSNAPDSSLFVNNIGSVGMGTGAPQRTLHLRDAVETPTLRFEDASESPQTWDIEADHLGFDLVSNPDGANTRPLTVLPDAPTASLFVSATGSVGMGTAVPDANSRLDIRSSLTNGVLAVRPDAGAHFLRVETTAGIFRAGVQGNGDAQFGALSPGKGLNLVAGGVTKVLVNSSGQVSFGNAPPAITDKALVHASTAHLTLGGIWTNASSRILKQDIEPITSEQARDTVRALQPVGYRYKSELDERYVGFIAEDVPELVATNDRKGLAPMDITAVLTKVVQDQQTLLDVQQTKLEKQDATIAALMERLDAVERANAIAVKRD